jgi:hypothetical protein
MYLDRKKGGGNSMRIKARVAFLGREFMDIEIVVEPP